MEDSVTVSDSDHSPGMCGILQVLSQSNKRIVLNNLLKQELLRMFSTGIGWEWELRWPTPSF